jgi:hypothetical protein
MTGRKSAPLLYNLPHIVTGAAGTTTDTSLAIARSHTHDAPFVARAYCILDSTKVQIITQPSQSTPQHSPSRSLHNPTACYLRSCPARYAGSRSGNSSRPESRIDTFTPSKPAETLDSLPAPPSFTDATPTTDSTQSTSATFGNNAQQQWPTTQPSAFSTSNTPFGGFTQSPGASRPNTLGDSSNTPRVLQHQTRPPAHVPALHHHWRPPSRGPKSVRHHTTTATSSSTWFVSLADTFTTFMSASAAPARAHSHLRSSNGVRGV